MPADVDELTARQRVLLAATSLRTADGLAWEARVDVVTVREELAGDRGLIAQGLVRAELSQIPPRYELTGSGRRYVRDFTFKARASTGRR